MASVMPARMVCIQHAEAGTIDGNEHLLEIQLQSETQWRIETPRFPPCISFQRKAVDN